MTLLATLAALASLAPLATPPGAATPTAGPGEDRCPYCREDPALMAASGVVSHGPFEFGTGTTADVERILPTYSILWTETEHFQIGTAMGECKLAGDERKPVRAELERLQLALPDVEPRARVLDPWVRAHLTAQRVEDLWDRFLEVVRVEESAFPAADARILVSQKYMGQGPYGGQKGKYELLILPSRSASRLYLTEQYGLPIERTQRWNVVARDTLTVTINTEEADLRRDRALHGHVVFNLTHLLLDGYKHYNYDTPLWYHEGLAHVLEREVSPEFNTFDGSEGALAVTSRKSDWLAETRKLARAGDLPRLAQLTRLREYGAFELEHHYATWSMLQFLLRRHPEELACFLDRMHGAVGPEAELTFDDMQDHHRESFQECLGASYAAFDAAWLEWLDSDDAELAQE